jgi:CheY-like chemotaxis protein
MVTDNAALPLAGLRVLVLEDEMILAMDLSDMLSGFGCVSSIASRVPKALDMLVAQDFDAAVVDVNLAGVSVYPVADELMRRGIDLVIVTGYGEEGVLPHYRTAPIISKPYTRDDILQALLHLQRPVVQPSEP